MLKPAASGKVVTVFCYLSIACLFALAGCDDARDRSSVVPMSQPRSMPASGGTVAMPASGVVVDQRWVSMPVSSRVFAGRPMTVQIEADRHWSDQWLGLWVERASSALVRPSASSVAMVRPVRLVSTQSDSDPAVVSSVSGDHGLSPGRLRIDLDEAGRIWQADRVWTVQGLAKDIARRAQADPQLGVLLVIHGDWPYRRVAELVEMLASAGVWHVSVQVVQSGR